MDKLAVKKRVIIVIVFIAIVVSVGIIVHYMITPDPTCSDKIQNQSEKSIDCGGPCSPCKDVSQTQDIIVKETAVVFGGNDTYDAVAKITNPNDSFGSSSFSYVLNLKDAYGKIVASRKGSSFVLPADTRYIPELGFRIEEGLRPSIAEFVISDVKWEKLGDIPRPQIGVYNKNFSAVSAGIGSQADGVIRNESGYDLHTIYVVVVLRGEDGSIVGINQTRTNSVRTKEERDFKLFWPYELSAPVLSMDVDAQTNVFDRTNFSFTVR